MTANTRHNYLRYLKDVLREKKNLGRLDLVRRRSVWVKSHCRYGEERGRVFAIYTDKYMSDKIQEVYVQDRHVMMR